MAAESHRNKSVAELKAFLSDRGINTSLYRKDALIRIAEAASALNLEPETENYGNYQTERANRRSVIVQGTSVTLPDICSVSDWQQDLSLLPNIETGDIMVYLMTKCSWTESRLKAYKNDNGYKLFQHRHIDNVVVKFLSYNHFYIKCTCVPETRQSEKPYTTWILMDNDGTVKSGGCTCVADDGTCKHCVALLFSLQSFSERHKDRGEETCTDKPCKWDKPRITSHPVTVEEISFRRNSSHPDKKDNYNPVSNQRHISHREITKILYKTCKHYGSVFMHTVDPPSDDSSDEEDSLEIKELSDIISDYKQQNPIGNENELIDYLRKIHSKDVINQIENLTKDQTDNAMWYKYRKGRITASVMGSVYKCRIENLATENYIVKKIFGRSSFSSAATEYGKAMESVALQQYFFQYSKDHSKAQIMKSGLVISENYPFIGASPDSLISCQCCGNGIVEIKCSYTHQHNFIKDIAASNDYHILLHEDNIVLNRSSSWYTQIQTQLFCTGLQWCDFVLYTRKDMAIERIVFDPEYFDCCLKKACIFFHKFLT
ncbi:uncharacterized protein LOC134282605 [Saccostrea cucullata]|uniref:uncharacterized protein LOC134282605 n=1 Tax=Saccostrea cuccullata TaxID=36930 RepID=UPI002ED11BC9